MSEPLLRPYSLETRVELIDQKLDHIVDILTERQKPMLDDIAELKTSHADMQTQIIALQTNQKVDDAGDAMRKENSDNVAKSKGRVIGFVTALAAAAIGSFFGQHGFPFGHH